MATVGSGTTSCAPLPSVYVVPTGRAWSFFRAFHTLRAIGSEGMRRFGSQEGSSTGMVTNWMLERSTFCSTLISKEASALASPRFGETLTAWIAACRKVRRAPESAT